MNKCITFRLIDKGKLRRIRSLYGGNKFNIVPTFYSSDIEQLMVIKDKGKVGFIINKDYENKENKETIDIKLLYMLIGLNVDKEELIDVLNAYWNGFQATIEVIKSMNNIDDYQKKIRIKKLETLLINCKDIKVPSKESLLESFSYISVY